MSLIHDTTMHPSKLELLAGWLATQPWFTGDVAQLASLGAYRFDDPEGEVGLEGYLLTAGEGKVYHVPLSYRGSPLEGEEPFLIGTSEHGVLGTRWISDATGDPVFRAVLAAKIAQGGREEELFLQSAEGEVSTLDRAVHVRGSGEAGSLVPELWEATIEDLESEVVIATPLARLDVRRVLDPSAAALDVTSNVAVLRATWPGQLDPVVLARLTV